MKKLECTPPPHAVSVARTAGRNFRCKPRTSCGWVRPVQAWVECMYIVDRLLQLNHHEFRTARPGSPHHIVMSWSATWQHGTRCWLSPSRNSKISFSVTSLSFSLFLFLYSCIPDYRYTFFFSLHLLFTLSHCYMWCTSAARYIAAVANPSAVALTPSFLLACSVLPPYPLLVRASTLPRPMLPTGLSFLFFPLPRSGSCSGGALSTHIYTHTYETSSAGPFRASACDDLIYGPCHEQTHALHSNTNIPFVSGTHRMLSFFLSSSSSRSTFLFFHISFDHVPSIFISPNPSYCTSIQCSPWNAAMR